MIWRRTVLLVLLATTGLVVQTSVLGAATLDGSKPEVMLLLTAALAITDGPALGAVAGFAFGLATDLLLGLPQGISALVYTAVGYGVGRARAQMTAPSAWLPMAMIFGATFGGVALYGGIAALFGVPLGIRSLVRHAPLAAVYNALLTPFVFPLVRAMGTRLRPAGVAR